MIKPIFLIGLPIETNLDIISKLSIDLAEKLSDYHVLLYQTKKSEMEFKCFHEKDVDDIRFDELKQLVKDNLNKS